MSIWKSKSTMKMAKSILRMSSSFKTGYETKKKTWYSAIVIGKKEKKKGLWCGNNKYIFTRWNKQKQKRRIFWQVKMPSKNSLPIALWPWEHSLLFYAIKSTQETKWCLLKRHTRGSIGEKKPRTRQNVARDASGAPPRTKLCSDRQQTLVRCAETPFWFLSTRRQDPPTNQPRHKNKQSAQLAERDDAPTTRQTPRLTDTGSERDSTTQQQGLPPMPGTGGRGGPTRHAEQTTEQPQLSSRKRCTEARHRLTGLRSLLPPLPAPECGTLADLLPLKTKLPRTSSKPSTARPKCQLQPAFTLSRRGGPRAPQNRNNRNK